MAMSDCCRGTFTCFLVFVNSILAMISVAVIGVAIYGLVYPLGTSAHHFMWSLLAAGIILLLTSIFGCVTSQKGSKGGIFCYAILLIIALVISAIFVGLGWTGVYALNGSTQCNFNPKSTSGSNCESYKGSMEMISAGYLSEAKQCDLTATSETDGTYKAACKNGDGFFASLVDSECPSGNSMGLVDMPFCIATVSAEAPDGLTPAEKIQYGLWAGYFCMCPSRFTNAYAGVLVITLIPSMIQAGLIVLLLFAACCLICLPGQREAIVAKYYTETQV